jgi:hypothetical protein
LRQHQASAWWGKIEHRDYINRFNGLQEDIWKSLKRLRWVVWRFDDTTLKRGAGTKRQNQTSDIGYLTSDINSLPAPLLLPFPQGSRWEKGRTGRRDYRDDLSFLNQIPFNPRQIETAQLYELWALYELYELPILLFKTPLNYPLITFLTF